MFYSKSTGGFYSPEINGDNIPADAVGITEAQHAAMLAAQSAGKQITADAQGSPIATDPVLTPEQIAAAAQAAKDKADETAAKADAKLQALAAMTPAQVRAWVAANVLTLPDAKDALATLAVLVSILARKI